MKARVFWVTGVEVSFATSSAGEGVEGAAVAGSAIYSDGVQEKGLLTKGGDALLGFERRRSSRGSGKEIPRLPMSIHNKRRSGGRHLFLD